MWAPLKMNSEKLEMDNGKEILLVQPQVVRQRK